MALLNISIVFKFLVGILLVQGIAAILVYAALNTDQALLWVLFAGLALGIGFLTALWFGSLSSHLGKEAVARVREGFLKEREQIRVKAEKEKTKVIRQSHQQLTKERKRAQSKASIRAGVSFATVAGLGALMLLTQFFTVGLLTLTTAGGAFGGYLLRARQDRHRGAARGIGGAPALGGRSAHQVSPSDRAVLISNSEQPPPASRS